MAKALNKIIDLLDDVLAYALTVAGILVSNYLPDLSSKGKINIEIDVGRVILALIVALILINKTEKTDGKPESRAARRKNFVIRMVNALSQGALLGQVSTIGK
jgi:hypothetical protein